MKNNRLNDHERRLWVLNDEGLYNWWRTEMRGEKNLRTFLRDNREELDKVINKALNR